MNKNYLNSLNWNRVKGNFEKFNKYRQLNADDRSFKRVTPKAIMFTFQSVIGDTNAYSPEIVVNDSAIDQACLQYYTYIRSFNSSIGKFTPADVMKYVIAIANLYAVWMHVYKTLSTFYYTNVLNRGATEQLRVILTNNNEDDARTEIASYIARLNVLKSRITAFTLPTNVPFVNRLMYLSGSIFADEPHVDYASFATFCPEPLEWQVGLDDALPGALLNVLSNSIITGLGIGDYVRWMERAVTRYATDEDVTDISSEMFKAQGQVQGVYDLPDVTEASLKAAFKPIFDLNVLDEIRNLSISCMDSSQIGTYQYGIQEDSNGRLKNSIIIANNTGYGLIAAKPSGDFEVDLKGYESESMLYSHELNPDGDTVTNISHLKHHLYSYSETTSAPSYIYGLKSEWVNGAVVAYTDETTGKPTVVELGSFNPYVPGKDEPLLSGLIDLDWCPDLFFGPVTEGVVTGQILNIHGTTDNYAIVNTDQLMQMSRLEVGYLFGAVEGSTDAFKGKSNYNRSKGNKNKGNKSNDKNTDNKEK